MDTHNSFAEFGLRLLIKYLGKKLLQTGCLSKSELDYLRTIMVLNPTTFQSVLHTLTRMKIDPESNLKINAFLKNYYEYIDVSHEDWGQNGLCSDHTFTVNEMIIGKPANDVRLDRMCGYIQSRRYGHFRKVSDLNTPWSYVYNNDIFAIGANNTTTIEYPIKATKTGTWMLNFVVNGEFERHSMVIK